MRVLALDVGEKRIGVALSDPDGVVASPLTTVDATDLARARRTLGELVSDWDVGTVLVGVPVSLDGTEGPQAVRVRAHASRLLEGIDVDTVYHDERFSSRTARRALREMGVDERAARGSVDRIAASVFLQSYLDALRASSDIEE